MPSPFPGMNPYLEKPGIWQDVHDALTVAIRDSLVLQIAPRYYVAIEGRTYIAQVEHPEYLGRPKVSLVTPSLEESHRGSIFVLPILL